MQVSAVALSPPLIRQNTIEVSMFVFVTEVEFTNIVKGYSQVVVIN